MLDAVQSRLLGFQKSKAPGPVPRADPETLKLCPSIIDDPMKSMSLASGMAFDRG